jgi:hypothetical protein
MEEALAMVPDGVQKEEMSPVRAGAVTEIPVTAIIIAARVMASLRPAIL